MPGTVPASPAVLLTQPNTWTQAQTFSVGPILGAAVNLSWSARSQIGAPADGQLTLLNAAGNDFGRLQFGGTTSSFPALKRSTTEIQARLADDSSFTAFRSGMHYVVSVSGAGNGGNYIYFRDSADGALGYVGPGSSGNSTFDIVVTPASPLNIYTTNALRWQFAAAGHLIAQSASLYFKIPATVVGSLPSAATAGAGARMFVSDATAQVFGATLTGGGSIATPVYSDGSAWRCG